MIGAVQTDDHALLLTVMLKTYAPVCVGVIVCCPLAVVTEYGSHVIFRVVGV